MYPIICKIGPVNIYSYGLMLAVAVLACAYFLSRDAKKQGISSEVIFDFLFAVVISGIVGARIFYVALHYSFFMEYPLEIIMIQHGGLSWQGGLLAGALAGIIFIKSKNLPLWKTADLIAPYLALGQSIGRIGCFLNGCCYGKPHDQGIFFPVHYDTLHPTQLYSTFGLLAIFFMLKGLQNKVAYDGQVFIYYLIYASMLRFVVEFFRADHTVLPIGGLSIFQVVCLLILTTAVICHACFKSQRRG